ISLHTFSPINFRLSHYCYSIFLLFHDIPTPYTYTLSLHDALPIYVAGTNVITGPGGIQGATTRDDGLLQCRCRFHVVVHGEEQAARVYLYIATDGVQILLCSGDQRTLLAHTGLGAATHVEEIGSAS